MFQYPMLRRIGHYRMYKLMALSVSFESPISNGKEELDSLQSGILMMQGGRLYFQE